jgi:hypothetical protein
VLRLSAPRSDRFWRNSRPSDADSVTIGAGRLDIEHLNRVNVVLGMMGARALERPDVAQERLRSVPEKVPAGVDLRANIRAAQKMSLKEFYDSVKNKGQWDFKQQGRQYQQFGNWHYGVVAKAAGIPDEVALRAAGAAQKAAGTSKPEWGEPTGDAPYGDDPDDQELIKQGMRFYEEMMSSDSESKGSTFDGHDIDNGHEPEMELDEPANDTDLL